MASRHVYGIAMKYDEFAHVMKAYGDMAYRMALQLTGGRDAEAGDLVQELFLKVWRRWDEPRPVSMKGWMYKVMRNLYIDAARYRQRRPAFSLQDTGGFEFALEDRIPDRGSTPLELLEQKDRQSQVRAALAQLDEEFRTPVMLCDIEGLRYEDIARVLDCPIGTVRSRIHRGRQRLREWLQPAAREEAIA